MEDGFEHPVFKFEKQFKRQKINEPGVPGKEPTNGKLTVRGGGANSHSEAELPAWVYVTVILGPTVPPLTSNPTANKNATDN